MRYKGMRRGDGLGWEARREGAVDGGQRGQSGSCERGHGRKSTVRRRETNGGGERGHV